MGHFFVRVILVFPAFLILFSNSLSAIPFLDIEDDEEIENRNQLMISGGNNFPIASFSQTSPLHESSGFAIDGYYASLSYQNQVHGGVLLGVKVDYLFNEVTDESNPGQPFFTGEDEVVLISQESTEDWNFSGFKAQLGYRVAIENFNLDFLISPGIDYVMPPKWEVEFGEQIDPGDNGSNGDNGNEPEPPETFQINQSGEAVISPSLSYGLRPAFTLDNWTLGMELFSYQTSNVFEFEEEITADEDQFPSISNDYDISINTLKIGLNAGYKF